MALCLAVLKDGEMAFCLVDRAADQTAGHWAATWVVRLVARMVSYTVERSADNLAVLMGASMGFLWVGMTAAQLVGPADMM